MFEIRFAPWFGPTMKRLGKPCDVDAVQALHAVGPMVGERLAVAAGRLEARTARVLGADLEARGEDDAVELVVNAVDPHAGLVDAFDTAAVGVDEVGTGLVERLEVFVVEARPLAQLAVPRLQRLGGLRRRRRRRRRGRGSRSSSRRRCLRTPAAPTRV